VGGLVEVRQVLVAMEVGFVEVLALVANLKEEDRLVWVENLKEEIRLV
jgi:hypothetical protein